MVDWWFDWHPRDPLRYRIWHPAAHRDNSLEPATLARAKAHWGAVHHPVEDVGTGVVHARIEFKAPTEMGMSSDALDDPRWRRSCVATRATTACTCATHRCSMCSCARATAKAGPQGRERVRLRRVAVWSCAAVSGSVALCALMVPWAASAGPCSTGLGCAAALCPKACPERWRPTVRRSTPTWERSCRSCMGGLSQGELRLRVLHATGLRPR